MSVKAAHPLGALIDKVKSANDWSDVDVARRAKDRGHIISKSNIARIRNEPVTTIVGKQLIALSEGLGIPVQQLAFAALESMGIGSYETSPADAEQAVRLDPTIPEHVRRTLLTIILNERDRYRRSDKEVTQPRTQEGSTEHGGAGSGSGQPGAPIAAGSSDFERAAARLGERARNVVRETGPDAGKPDDLIDDDQVSRADYELAARKGETEAETRKRLGIPYE